MRGFSLFEDAIHQEGYHVVRNGESLSYILNKYKVSIQDILKLNNLDNINKIKVGRRIKVSYKAKEVRNVFEE